MFLRGGSEDNDVVRDVHSTRAATDDLLNNVLIQLWCRADAEHQSLEAVDAGVNRERRDVSAVLLEHDLVEPHPQVDLGEAGGSVHLLQNFVDRRHWITLPDDRFVSTTHVNAYPDVSIRLRPDNHGADPSGWSLHFLDQVRVEQLLDLGLDFPLQSESDAPGPLWDRTHRLIHMDASLVVRQPPDAGEHAAVLLFQSGQERIW